MGKFHQSQRVLEQLSVLQVAILEHAIFEGVDDFDLLPVEESVAYSDDSLLHLFSQLDASFE